MSAFKIVWRWVLQPVWRWVLQPVWRSILQPDGGSNFYGMFNALMLSFTILASIFGGWRSTWYLRCVLAGVLLGNFYSNILRARKKKPTAKEQEQCGGDDGQ